MTQPIITCKNVAKVLPTDRGLISLRHDFSQFLSRTMGLTRPKSHMVSTPTLSNINLEIYRGESVGIIGRNGAGKTTLLRLLSQIWKPTTGEIKVHGRLIALLGVSAGFDTERTGRENILLNAAFFKVSYDEIMSQINNIIEFSELGESIDIPVKKYSTGMVARLGFSIAVHVLPEIIIIDEILSVGDTNFREKSLERMQSLMQSDKLTVLFVSHSLPKVVELCERSIWIEQGQIVAEGLTADVIKEYRQFMQNRRR